MSVTVPKCVVSGTRNYASLTLFCGIAETTLIVVYVPTRGTFRQIAVKMPCYTAHAALSNLFKVLNNQIQTR